jgi:hypothetical protein
MDWATLPSRGRLTEKVLSDVIPLISYLRLSPHPIRSFYVVADIFCGKSIEKIQVTEF